MEARELVAGSFLEGAPVAARLGAHGRRACDALRDGAAARWRRRRRAARRGRAAAAARRPRLHAARASARWSRARWSRAPLARGRRAGGPARADARARVRGLQVHGAAVDARGGGPPRGGEPGRRRGGRRGARRRPRPAGHPARHLDRRRRAHAARPASGRSRTRPACACTSPARRSWPACASSPGRRSWSRGRPRRVQLRLERPAVAGRGDRLVIRSYSPAATIGGRGGRRSPGPPQAAAARARRRPRPGRPRRGRHGGARRERRGSTPPRWPRGSPCPVADARCATLGGRADRGRPGRRSAARDRRRAALDGLAADAQARLAAFHAANPLKPAMPREELRGARLPRAAPTAPSSTSWRASPRAGRCAVAGGRRRAGRATPCA